MANLNLTEHELTILGVPGRMYPRHPRSNGTWAAQKWISQARPIKGYDKGAGLRVEIRFDDSCSNGHDTFAITADVRVPGRRDIEAGGCLHEDIARVFPELAPLIRWHLVSTDGPMHYVANTVYHADEHGPTHAWVYYTAPESDPLGIGDKGERLLSYAKRQEAEQAEGKPGYRVQWDIKTVKTRNLDHARSCAVWPEATDAELTVDRDALKAALLARHPQLMAEFRQAMENAGLAWSPAKESTP